MCSATIVDQWVRELRNATTIAKVNKNIISIKPMSISVLSYGLLKAAGHRCQFDIVVLDEGHKIKNHKAEITILAKRIRAEARFILTGTPIQNNLSEMWSLFDFIVPGLLGSHLAFQEEFVDIIKRQDEPERAYKFSVQLRAIIYTFILRRLKSHIAHRLPEKKDKVVFVTLSRLQHDLYIKALESSMIKTAIFERKGLFEAIDHLRKICNILFFLIRRENI